MNQPLPPPSPPPAAPPPPPGGTPSPPLDRKRIAAVVAVLVLLVGFSVGLQLVTRRFAPNPRQGWRARSADIRARSERLRTRPATDPTRVYVPQSCPEVVDRFGLQSDLTREQAARVWAEQYAGRWVRWAVSVNRIDRFGGALPQVQFKCSDRSFAFDGAAFFRPDQSAALRAIAPNTVIEFEGELVEQDAVLGVTVQRAELLR